MMQIWNRMFMQVSTISKTRASVSSGYLNTEKQIKARGRRRDLISVFWDVKVAGVASIYKFSCRLVRMHMPYVYGNKVVREISAAKKCGGWEKSVNAVPKSTA